MIHDSAFTPDEKRQQACMVPDMSNGIHQAAVSRLFLIHCERFQSIFCLAESAYGTVLNNIGKSKCLVH